MPSVSVAMVGITKCEVDINTGQLSEVRGRLQQWIAIRAEERTNPECNLPIVCCRTPELTVVSGGKLCRAAPVFFFFHGFGQTC